MYKLANSVLVDLQFHTVRSATFVLIRDTRCTLQCSRI